MKNQKNNPLVPFALGLILTAIMFVSLQMVQPSQAAPPPAPTPIANLVSSDSYVNVTWLITEGIIADTQTSSRQLPGYTWLDIQSTIDQSTTNNLTITVQFSNDDSNWDDGQSIVANNSADATDITRVPIFGRYLRWNIDLTGTDRVTITLLGPAKK